MILFIILQEKLRIMKMKNSETFSLITSKQISAQELLDLIFV